MRKVAAVAVPLVLLSASLSQAQEGGRDLHSPSVSPDSSSGVNPRTTRGMDRGDALVTPELGPTPDVTGAPPAGTTTITAAGWYNAEAPRRDDRSRPHRTMLYTGGAIFLGTYAASAIVGGVLGADGDRNLVIPVAGPWMALAQRTPSCALGQCGLFEDVNLIGIVASAIAQAAGLGLAIGSFFVDETRPTRQAPPRAGVHVYPGGAFGTF